MGSSERTYKISAVSIVKYGVLTVILVSLAALWFLPSIIHVRDEYRPYDETVHILQNNHIERRFEVYRPWETDLKLTGKFLVNGNSYSKMHVMDWENYMNWRSGLNYGSVYSSNVKTALEFLVELPSKSQGINVYYLVFENPSSTPIEIVYDAGIIFERAYMGYAYTAWLSRIAMATIVVAAFLKVYSSQYRIKTDIGKIFLSFILFFLLYLIVSRSLAMLNLWAYPF